MQLIAENDAVAYAGPEAVVAHSASVSYAIGRCATVVIVDAGDRPGGSALSSADRIDLRAPFPRPVAERLGPEPDLPIYGFVRLPSGCLPLGPLRVMTLSSRPTGNGPLVLEATGDGFRAPWDPRWLVDCSLHLDEPLPFDVLDRARPAGSASPPDLTWLTYLPDDPLGAVHAFVAGWHAAIPPTSDGVTTARLPRPLREFYRAARGRKEVLGQQNRIFPPERIYPSDDGAGIVIGTENQGVFRLRIDPAADDPAVWYLGLSETPLAERVPLRAFLLQFLLCEAALAGPHGGFAVVRTQETHDLVRRLQRVPLPPMRWPADPTHHYVGPGFVVMTSEAGEGYTDVYAGSRQRAALRPLRDPGFAWDSFDG